MDDRTVRRAQHGDREAFGDRLHAVTQGVLRDTSMAEDASQQALLQIWRDLPKLREPNRFLPWAYRLTVRVCYAEAKRSRRTICASIDEVRREPSVGDQVNAVVDRDELERAFGRLSLDHRTVVVMHHYLGMSLAQVAESLAIPVDTVRSRLYHAMRALRTAIEADSRVELRLPVAGEAHP